jgi:hypothetical protein
MSHGYNFDTKDRPQLILKALQKEQICVERSTSLPNFG